MRKNILNLRHLRAFREVARHKSISVAATKVHLSQPAITQAIANLESRLGVRVFYRRGNGMFLTEPGELFLNRVTRALVTIRDGARLATKTRVPRSAKGFAEFDQLVTFAQLRSLLAVAEAGNFSLAARLIDISQPSLHRTARDLERLSGLAMFNKTGQGISLTPAATVLTQHVGLAFSELDQGLEEIENWLGADTGRIVIGTMPLARTLVLPQAINALLKKRPEVDVSVIDGPYGDLLHGLRHGKMDLLIGALRDPLPIDDIVQEELFRDTLAVVCRTGHPLADKSDLKLDELTAYPWIVPRADTPTRAYFDNLVADASVGGPPHVVEASSLVLIRGLLLDSDRLTIMSAHQMSHEEEYGLLKRLSFDMSETSREIGITLRKNWHPTATQSHFLELLRDAGRQVHA